MLKKSSLLLLVAAPALVFSSASSAGTSGRASSQSMSSTTNCWGVVNSQLAKIETGVGSHASSQDTPRLGLGNVAQLFYDMGFIDEPTIGALGSFLASIDEYDGTYCPA